MSAQTRNKFRKFLLESLEDRRLLTGVPSFNAALLMDLNDTVLSSNPTAAVQIQGTTYFAATTQELGTELWATDGTTAGTNLVADLAVGQMSGSPRNLTTLGNQIVFVSGFAEEGSLSPGAGLFTYDGSVVTRLATLSEFSSGFGESSAVFALGNELIVVFQDSFGTSLWKTNGEVSGTQLLSSGLVAGSMSMTTVTYASAVLGGVLLINLPGDGFSTSSTLIRTDGTSLGTQVIRSSDPSFGPDAPPADIVIAGGKAFFVSNSSLDGLGLYATDGTAVGTQLVMTIGGGFLLGMIGSMAELDGLLYFTFNDGFEGNDLWKSNGTAAGTMLAVDIAPGLNTGIESKLFVWQGALYFAARTNGKVELFTSDGTALGTQQVYDSGTTFGLIPSNFSALPGAFVFQTWDGQLWGSDGTSSGTLFLSTVSGFSYTAVGSQVYFVASSPGFGRELWKTDGTVNGTARLSDLNPGGLDGVDEILAATSNGVIFRGTSALGTELGFSNGTVNGTYLIDVAQGTPPADIVDYVAVGSDFYVSAVINGQRQLLKVNSDTGVKTVLRNFNFGSPVNLTYWNGHVYFAASGASNQGVELWRTNGTFAGTLLWKDMNPGSASSSPRNFTVFNNRLFFTARTASNGEEMWEVDLAAR